MYAIRMPEFLPTVSDPRLPQDVQERLNGLLHRRGTELLAGQQGLVIEIARAVRPALPPEPAWPTDPPTLAEPGSLAPSVLAWLSDAAGADVRAHEAVVASALRTRLDLYERFEATVVAGLNQHLSGLMRSLGLDPGPGIGACALARVCGQTLRDWDSRQGLR
jgi:hypothetical protein